MDRRVELRIIIARLISDINNVILNVVDVTANLSNYKLFLENIELLKKYQEEFDSLK